MNSELFVTSCLVVASLIEGRSGCRVLEFLDCEQNKTLTGHVVKALWVPAPGLKSCQHQCFLEGECVSYNLGPVDGMSRICNLSDTDHVGYPGDVKPVPGAEYCPIKNPCASSPCPIHQACKPDFESNTYRCRGRLRTTCADLKIAGVKESGVYTITPVPGFNVQVFCDQETDGGGWTVIQKRLDGSVDFYRGWDDYKRGFGNKSAEYWLGLDTINILTNREENELRVELEDLEGNRSYALYGSFKVGPESQNYSLNVAGFKEGDAGDSLTYQSAQAFSTFDRDNDVAPTSNCAVVYKGSWWYNHCHACNLNGLYLNGSYSSAQYAQGMVWSTWKGYLYSAKETRMKIRNADFKQ